MEVLAVLGLASNIVQFLDFSGRLVSSTLELYEATEGALSSNSVLEEISTDLKELCDGLLPSGASGIGPTRTKSEAALLSLSQSCRAMGQKFLLVLEDLKVKGKGKGWQSARQALRTAWKAKEIQRYERQLGEYRSQIAVHLLAILGLAGDITSIAKTLDQLKDDHHRLGISATNEAAELRQAVISSLERFMSRCHTGNTADLTQTCASTQLPSDLACWLSRISSAGALLSKQVSIIDSLSFPQILQREENIKEAHPTTFDWLFESACSTDDLERPPRVLDWLRTGSDVFWINGRAGSGKSTLMKFLYNHPKTTAALKEWSGSRRLFVASFFSWNAGTMMQKSQQGLLQTLLYHILRQDPVLIPSVCPSRWNQISLLQNAWSHAEVLTSFTKLKEQDMGSVRFCFFIDGLDEFDGDHLDIIQTINAFASSDAIKVCFSSRPWAVFESAYGTNHGMMIRVQDLTRGDITRFVKDRLAEGTQFLRLKHTDPAYESLVHEILGRSNGVFLWVYLVVRSLRRGMTNYDTVSELQTRLRELPVELEEYFQHMLDSTEKVYHQHAARLYLIRLVVDAKLDISDVSMFAEDIDFALRYDLTSDSQRLLPTSIEATKRRILVRCQDLLEFDRDSELQFLHRTVKSFLETRDVRNLLDRRAGPDFNPHHFMCNSMLLRMRRMAEPPEKALMTLRDFEAAMASFFSHAHIMEIEDQPNYRLFPLLDKTVWKYFRKPLIVFFNHGNNSRIRDPPNTLGRPKFLDDPLGSQKFRGMHYEGWLADKAARSGVEGYLPYSIGTGLQVLSLDGNPMIKPPLEVALRSMVSDERSRIIGRLLDAGADPNEKILSAGDYHRNSSIWQAYIGALAWTTRSPRKDNATIIEMLLMKGADPSIGGPIQSSFSQSLRIEFGISDEEAAKLDALRRSLLSMRSEQQQAIGDWGSEIPLHVRGYLPIDNPSSNMSNTSKRPAKRAHESDAMPGEETRRVMRKVEYDSNSRPETRAVISSTRIRVG
ncbi:MAG: hypothetical protein Q9208_008524 [Pyrenodesmia sp. 3 TL-2023]